MAATEKERSGSESARGATWGVTLLKFSLVAAVVVLLNIGISWAIAEIEMQIWPSHLEIVDRVVLAGEVHAGLDVCGVSGAGDKAGTAVDHAVEYGTSGVVPGVRRADDLPAELAGESFHGVAGDRGAGRVG
jgi:hypothetical protein